MKRSAMAKPSKKCAECEGQFIPNNNRQILCGDECYRKRQQKQKKAKCVTMKPRKCEGCGHVFNPRTSKHVACSKPCFKRIQRKRARVNKEQNKQPIMCRECGEMFIARSNVKICSDACRERRRSMQIRREREGIGSDRNERLRDFETRAQKKGGYYFTHEETGDIYRLAPSGFTELVASAKPILKPRTLAEYERRGKPTL